MNFSSGVDRRDYQILSCSGFMLGYVAFCMGGRELFTLTIVDHQIFPVCLPKEVIQKALSLCLALKSTLESCLICLSVAPKSLAALGNIHRLLTGLYIMCECVREYGVAPSGSLTQEMIRLC